MRISDWSSDVCSSDLIAKVKDMQYAMLERCLNALGYRPFKLTDAQRERLNDLAPGSDARRDYLHGLAADPEVLAAQGDGALLARQDRESVEEGTGGSVRVDIGCGGILKKKKKASTRTIE